MRIVTHRDLRPGRFGKPLGRLPLGYSSPIASATRETFLAAKPTPWAPWTLASVAEWTPKALDPKNPSAKIKQALFDYALWHGQGAYIEKLGWANFAPAQTLI